jgi:preprotein translocase subunit SecA
MDTIQLSVDEQILKKFGEEKIKEYVNKMISVKKLEFFTDLISKSIDMPQEEYEKELEEIRKESWEEYKKDLPL